ncbi:3'(2'),5'-bisphosphate nucleotidase CysQ [Wenxinia saemankumensis]|uniref:Myo-inositol-1(Or 4)-monophosphatase n=1 Tax=Wenxinia saemankumensis TaxID=1447782 RepID=A0A1M6E2V6_9RHOB|nr:3'(2'),5'-bisphosphate nucleotidase CysQ [Wenxinia saemankumensis]SHI79874.1 myo-inositol-1(or 4)-monophosphatase [Wenxinia saemankumensis]
MPAIEADAADLALLIEAAEEAGGIALRYARRGFRTTWKPDDSPVTEADMAVDAHLRARLLAARPGYGWLSEETPDGPERLAARRVFVVDPIDGTRAYAEGAKDWAHSLAVVEDGVPVAAVVLLPMHGRLYAAARGGGAALNGAPIRASRREEVAGAAVLAAKPALAPHHWTGGALPPFRRTFRSSLAYRLARVAEGADDAMLTLRPVWEWDVAAGALLVTEAGGAATDRRGAPARFNAAHPQLDGMVAGGAVQSPLRALLA